MLLPLASPRNNAFSSCPGGCPAEAEVPLLRQQIEADRLGRRQGIARSLGKQDAGGWRRAKLSGPRQAASITFQALSQASSTAARRSGRQTTRTLRL